MRRILVVSAGLLVGCGSTVTQQDIGEAAFIDIGAAQFAVYTQQEQAMAVYFGTIQPQNLDRILPAAQKAIERVSGCPVVRDSLESNAKMVSASLDCSRTTSLFVRARSGSRGRTGYSGNGNPPEWLLKSELLPVATEHLPPSGKQ